MASRTRRSLTTLALMACLFMAALEGTVVTTAMPTVVGQLGGIEDYAWVFTVYLIASTLTVPLLGKLADLQGRKRVVMGGLVIFLVGSIACGLAPSMGALIACRAFQGLGAGAMQLMSLTIAGDIFTLEQRAKVQGLFGGVWGLAGLIGPWLGGFIVHQWSWHWVFFLNVPVGIGAIILLWTSFHEEVTATRRPLDWLGSVLIAGCALALLWASQEPKGLWLSLGLAAVFFAGFVSVERRVAEPVLPLGLFKLPAIAVSATSGALFSAAMYGAITYVPLYVQSVLQGTPTQAGGMITPMIVAWPITSTLGGRLLTRVGFRPLIVGGLGLAAVANFVMASQMKPGAPIWVAQAAMALFGAGLGFANTALLLAVQNSVSWDRRGVATATNGFARSMGSALGVGVIGGVLVSRLTREVGVDLASASAVLRPEGAAKLDPALYATLSGALERGLSLGFWLTFALSVGAFLAALVFFPRDFRVQPSAPIEGSPAPTH
jgi:EmrB/QacA subfamily drug resistance transporter